MKGLVLAGGHGTRLRPLTFTGNKHMLPVANQPILFYGLRQLAQAGIREVAVVLGPVQEGIREAVGDGRPFGLEVQYLEQPVPRGLADAVLLAQPFLGDEPFVMYLGDNLLQSGPKEYLDAFASGRPDAIIGVAPVAHPERYGVVELEDGRIRSIEEKPSQPRSDLALVGVYLFTERIHPIVRSLSPSARGELEITDAIRRLWQDGDRVRVLQLGGWWKDTGRPEDLLEANRLILGTLPASAFAREGTTEPGAIVEGSVGLGSGTRVSRGARIVGPTLIGRNVTIAPDSEVGPDCAIGDGVTIDRCRVRNSIVLAGARLRGVRLADSVVGREVTLVGDAPTDHELHVVLGDRSEVVY